MVLEVALPGDDVGGRRVLVGAGRDVSGEAVVEVEGAVEGEVVPEGV
jgi:hypothetical protein